MNGIANATAWALVHFLWQGALVGLATGGVLAFLERRRASIRHAVALGALLLMAALPFLTVLRLAPVQVEPPYAVPATAASPGNSDSPPAPSPWSAGILPASPVPQTFGGSLLPWILGVWLAGVALLSMYHLGGWSLTRRLSRHGQPVSEAAAALTQDLCRRLGIRRWVTFLESTAVSVPTVIGWLRPVVLVPASALAGLSPAQLEAILAHELAHVRRHDYLVNLFQTAVETLLFYHPAVWWVSAQIRRERENCCDDLAVAVCGDRLSYARALVDLEGLRTPPPLALAASGGSLSERVRRLAGAPGRPARRLWAAGLLALALLPAGAAVQVACSHGSAEDGKSASVAEGPREPGTWQGRWKAEDEGHDVRIEMTFRKRDWGSWTSVDAYSREELAGLAAGPDVTFELRRDAGTFRFRGSFDGQRGRGDFTFDSNPAFARMMGLARSNERLLELAIQNISFDFAREMRELGLGNPEPKQAARRDRSPLAFVHNLLGLQHRDSFVDQLVELRIHRITPDYVRGMKEAGYPHLETWQLVQFRIHAIEPDYVRGLRQSGYRHVLPFRIVEFHNHGITPEWLRDIAEAGYANATPGQIISLHAHAIDGDFIREARSQGYEDLSPEELISLRSRGVTSPASRSRRSLAAGPLALSLFPAGPAFQFARFSASEPEVSSSSVRLAAAAAPAAGRAESGRRGTWSLERQSDGRVWLEMRMRSENGRHNWNNSSTLPASELRGLGAGPEVRFEIRRDAGTFHFEGRLEGKQGTGFFTFAGNPTYARDMAAMGYRVSEDRLLEMALHDVSLSFVREIHELGYRDATLDKLVEFRIHGVSPAFIRDMMSLGYRDVPADRLVEFRIHGVSPAYVRELAEAGYRDLPAERLVEFRIHGVDAEFIRKAASRGYRNLSASDLVELKIMGRLDRER